MAGYYGSDSAGPFAFLFPAWACRRAAKLLYAPYMPVMLAVMEVPSCLVALFLVTASRRPEHGCGRQHASPNPLYREAVEEGKQQTLQTSRNGQGSIEDGAGSRWMVWTSEAASPSWARHPSRRSGIGLLQTGSIGRPRKQKARGFIVWNVLHEVFFNPGLYLLFGGILIGFIAQLQGVEVTGRRLGVPASVRWGLVPVLAGIGPDLRSAA